MHRSLVPLVLAVLAVTLPACDRGKAPEAAPADARAAAAETDAKAPVGAPGACDAAHAEAIEQELTAQCELTPKVLERDVPSAPWKAMPSGAPEDALRIDVSGAGVVLGWGPPIAFEALTADRLAAERDQLVEMAATYGRPRPEGFVLAIDPAATRSQVAAVLQALEAAGLRQGHLRLGTDSPGPVPQPRDPKLLAEVASKIGVGGPSEKATLLARELERVVPACPPVAEVFATLAAQTPDERCPLMAKRLSQGLVKCSCAKETEILTLVYALTVGLETPKRLGIAVPITLDPKAAPVPGRDWSEMVKNLDQSTLALWVNPA